MPHCRPRNKPLSRVSGGPFLARSAVIVDCWSGCQILQPLGHLSRRTGAQVAIDISVCANEFHKIHELVSAELVGFGNASPVGVYGNWSLVARPDSISPVILVCEASSWPAHHGNFERSQCGDDVLPKSSLVRNCRMVAHPNAVIDAMPQMLGELTVDVTIDDRTRLLGMHNNSNGLGTISGRKKKGREPARSCACRRTEGNS